MSHPLKPRILIAKPGLDGHDRGAKYVAHILRDAGFEATYTGIRKTPEEIVTAALRGRFDAIGLSLLSGAHNELFPRVLELLREAGRPDVPVFGGGIIPESDAARLVSQGVAAIFTPGVSAREIVETIRAALAARRIVA